MKSHLNFYPLAVSKKLVKFSCFIEQNSDRNFKLEIYKNSTAICFSDKIPTGKIETYPMFYLTILVELLSEKQMGTEFLKIPKPSGLYSRNS
jgi:hypothetical protein